ncbi:hypothetical protein ONS96_002518 [Cadophora gregata f. sp. sojae]|nr:hypothetical protein ONS96_002518 [Cadophora gregata f. sp. sojae]
MAMLEELDDFFNVNHPELGKFDEENRIRLRQLLKTPSDKIWELVLIWKGWAETGEVKLGRCPLPRELLKKFIRVLEMSLKFFKIVNAHEVDEKRFPTQQECEMWDKGLHPEQIADKKDKELKEYWSPLGGHIHEYYEKKGL